VADATAAELILLNEDAGIAVAGVLGQPNIYYLGAVSGGIWNTDGGTYWKLIFEGQPSSSNRHAGRCGLDPEYVWVGTAKSCIHSNVSIG
jgi:hypothetical protein